MNWKTKQNTSLSHYYFIFRSRKSLRFLSECVRLSQLSSFRMTDYSFLMTYSSFLMTDSDLLMTDSGFFYDWPKFPYDRLYLSYDWRYFSYEYDWLVFLMTGSSFIFYDWVSESSFIISNFLNLMTDSSFLMTDYSFLMTDSESGSFQALHSPAADVVAHRHPGNTRRRHNTAVA